MSDLTISLSCASVTVSFLFLLVLLLDFESNERQSQQWQKQISGSLYDKGDFCFTVVVKAEEPPERARGIR
jgi:hypothetical protein